MANNSTLSRRAALRQQQEQEEQAKRNRRILGFGLGAVALAVVVILVIVVLQSLGKSNQQAAAEQLTPPNATAEYGILMDGKEPTDGVPHLVIYQDFQCGACAGYEETYGPTVTSLFDQGKITVEFRTATFMDVNMGNDSSTRAALAAAAADEVGHYEAYHNALFTSQNGSAGFSENQLRVELPAQSGIEGDDLARFQELYDTRAFKTFVESSAAAFSASPLTGTPAYMIGDTQLEFYDEENAKVTIEATEDSLMQAINDAYQG